MVIRRLSVKKIVAIGNTIFIYLIAILPVMLIASDKSKFITWIWKYLFHNSVFVPLILLLFGAVMYILNIIFMIQARNGCFHATDLARANMIVKLIQIPAYIFIFMIGILCMVMIFTIGISFVLLLLDALSIGLTGLFAIAAFQNLNREGMITRKAQFIYSIASFLFCVDVIIAVIGYRKSLSVTTLS